MLTPFKTARLVFAGLAVAISGATVGPSAQAQDLAEEIVAYMEFATATQGIILPEQLTADIFPSVTFIDTRPAAAFEKSTIPGARHIEWREVPSRLDEIPETGMVILFCTTGVRSSQAMLASRLMGRDNILVLQSGYEGWLETAAYRP